MDPFTGEEIQPGTVLHHADMLRALLTALSVLNREIVRAKRRAVLPGNVGRSWTPEEETALVSAAKGGESVASIAVRHGRTERAIELRLQHLGLLANEDRTSRSTLADFIVTNPSSVRGGDTQKHPTARGRSRKGGRSPKRSA
jgi:hypothetical protein